MTTVLAADLGGTKLRAAIVDAGGQIRYRRQIATPERGAADDTLASIERLLAAVLDDTGERPASACLAVAGLVDGAAGTVVAAPNIPGFRNVRLAERLEARFGLRVRVENDASAAGLAEFRFGAGRGARNLLHATLGTGIGGGIVIDGKLYRGSRGFAGEIGHVIVDMGGPPCACGSRGCVEALVSGTAFTRRGTALLAAGRSPRLAEIVGDREPEAEDLLAAARGGDTACEAEIRHGGHVLGLGLGSVITVLNPDRVTLSGGLLAMGDLLLDPMHEALGSIAYGPAAGTKIRLTELEDDPGLLGAAAVAFEAIEQG